ncbi:hypothetical protein SKAU_G00139550 [Synaphobranchus kaupii]|uniref:Uncharacterized protein n=1 Tax=Synaphobranchus kaupii TaxID=118154 RepID=A0A9Q1FSB5_SYNKA|nr:hypothetical protein SKAU_G00139550 [Synaphobranchus kaupii]
MQSSIPGKDRGTFARLRAGCIGPPPHQRHVVPIAEVSPRELAGADVSAKASASWPTRPLALGLQKADSLLLLPVLALIAGAVCLAPGRPWIRHLERCVPGSASVPERSRHSRVQGLWFSRGQAAGNRVCEYADLRRTGASSRDRRCSAGVGHPVAGSRSCSKALYDLQEI